jgi:hypothetical protein
VPTEAPQYLTDHVARAIARALRAPGIGNDPLRQVQLCNQVLDLVAREVPDAVAQPDDAVARAALLLAVLDQPAGILPVRRARRPETPLAQDALFVHAPHEPNLASELAVELESADGVAHARASPSRPCRTNTRATHNLFADDELSYVRSVRTGVEQSTQKGR